MPLLFLLICIAIVYCNTCIQTWQAPAPAASAADTYDDVDVGAGGGAAAAPAAGGYDEGVSNVV